MQTVVIEIQAQYRDNASGGAKNTASNIDRVGQSIEKTRRQTEKASKDMQTLSERCRSIASKVISIPVKVLDYATRPLRGIFNFATSLRGILTGLFAGMVTKKMINEPVALADAYKSAYIGFETLFKDQMRAQKMMKDLDTFAKATPFKASGVIGQTQRMLAMGWNPDNIIKDMRRIGDAAAATGKGDEGLGRIVLALSQIKSKGKLSTEELNQLAEAGISAKRYISEGLGFGSDDAGLAKMTKALEGGKIGSDAALKYLLDGMKEYEGMMDKTAKETVEGIKSNLEDTLEINVARRWGQGIQEGMKTGLGAVADMLDANEEGLERIGDQLQEIGRGVSVAAADTLKDTIDRAMKVMDTAQFKSADLFGKAGMLWDSAIVTPFAEWWNGEGGASFKAKAHEIGVGIGNAIAEGVFGAMKTMLGSAGKLLPGGEAPDALSWLSGGLLLKGASGLGITKGIGNLVGGIVDGAAEEASARIATGSATRAGVGLAGAGIGGAVIGGVGLISAINDIRQASKTINQKTRQDYMIQGATKAGMVAAGTALGAAVGSIIPGLGTLVGAGVGAGLGGLGALFAGGGLGIKISDTIDGTARLKELGAAAVGAKEKVESAYAKAEEFKALIEKYKQTQIVVELVDGSNNGQYREQLTAELTTLKEQAAAIEAKIKNKDGTKKEIEALKEEARNIEIETITINAVLGNVITGEEKQKLTDRIAELEKEKVTIEAKLSDTSELSENETAALTAKRTLIEAQLTGIKAAVGELDTKSIDQQLTDLQTAKEVLLKLKQEGTLDEGTKKIVDKALSANTEAELALKITATGLSPEDAQGYTDRVEQIKQALIDASDGLLQKYSLEHTAMDTSISKLNTILRLKEQEAKIADAELMQGVYKARGEYGSFPEKLQQQREESEWHTQNAARADIAAEAINQFGEEFMQTKIQNELKQNDPNAQGPHQELDGFGLTEAQNKAFQDKFAELRKQYGEFMPNEAWQMLGGFLGHGDHPANYALGKVAEGSKASNDALAQYYGTEFQFSKLYANERDMIERNLEGKYGGTLDELAGKAFGGSPEDRKNFERMISDIAKLGSETFGALSDDYKFSGADLVKAFEGSMTGSMVNAFAGQERLPGNDPYTALWNALVDKGKDGAFEADKTIVSDTSGKIADKTAKKNEIAAMQEVLSRHGYLDSSGVDGYNGPKTQAAIAQFNEDVASGALSLETFPAATAEASAAATVFAAWLRGLIDGGTPNGPGTGFSTGGTGAPAGSAGVTDEVGSNANSAASGLGAVSDSSTKAATSENTAASSASSLGREMNGAASATRGFKSEVGSFRMPSFGGGDDPAVPHAKGGIFGSTHYGMVAEDGPEAIIPLSEQRRERGIALWEEAGRRLGIRRYANGGIVGGGGQSGAPSATPGGGIVVQVSPGAIAIEVQASGDTGGVIEAIRAKMPEVANEVAEFIARALEKTYSNMPLTEAEG